MPNSKLAERIFKNEQLPVPEIIQTISGSVPEFQPFIRYQSFEDFSIHLIVYLRVNDFFNQSLVKHEFIQQLHKRYQEDKIEIPFPTPTVYLKDKH